MKSKAKAKRTARASPDARSQSSADEGGTTTARFGLESLMNTASNDTWARLERETHPLPGGHLPSSDLKRLRKNVKSMYDDARTHIGLERESGLLLVELQKQVAQLQRAFHSLSEVVVEEFEMHRDVAEQQSVEIKKLRARDEAAHAMRLEVERLGRYANAHQRQTEEMGRVGRAEAERERREGRMLEELRNLRAQSAHDRSSVEKARHKARTVLAQWHTLPRFPRLAGRTRAA